MSVEARELDVDGTTYRLRPWSYEDGTRWMHRLFGILMDARGALSGADADDLAIEGGAIGKLSQAFDAKTFADLREMVEKYTDLVATEDGVRRVQSLKKVAAVHMVGRYVDLAILMRAHLEGEFGPFFLRLPEIVRVPGRAS